MWPHGLHTLVLIMAVCLLTPGLVAVQDIFSLGVMIWCV
jgi:hypothetical protein